MTVEQLKDLLRRYQLTPNKTFGQNFLLDDIVLQDMVDAAGVTKQDVVLEVGPGIATLTRYLAHSAKFVFSVEKDKSFLPLLRSLKKEAANFQYVVDDILKFNFAAALHDYPEYRVVANIPYYITGKIIQLFIHASKRPKSITMLVQKEVGENIVAGPGHMNLLALSVQLYSNPKTVQVVPARSFYPAPKVDSVIVHIDFPVKLKYQIADEKKLFRIARACFAGKRKQLHNTLVNNLKLDKKYVNNLLKQISIPITIRPQQLTIDQWLQLSETIKI